jgi:hypothetical protein
MKQLTYASCWIFYLCIKTQKNKWNKHNFKIWGVENIGARERVESSNNNNNMENDGNIIHMGIRFGRLEFKTWIWI